MARQPKQIHVYLYRRKEDAFEYAIFQRADLPYCWQGICGGLEDGETYERAAYREIYEEAGISDALPLYELESVSYLPINIFKEAYQKQWSRDIVVIPMHFFAMPFYGDIVLSSEHLEAKWLPYKEAYELVYFHDQKTALFELNERLQRNLLK